VRRHLSEQGEFWISIHNPPQRRNALDGRNRPIGKYVLATGEELHVSGEYLLDTRTDIATGRQFYRCFANGKPTRSLELPVRFHLISPERLEQLLDDAELTVLQRFGTYERDDFDSAKSPVYIAQCRMS
ncbi:MAG: hypothetical protein GX621_09795, partial [Pirellulaceae bacterium]|nr:hypothetical protein [Pirellulaceae bacterium]